MQNPLKLEEYNGNRDPDEHMQFFNDGLNYYCVDDASKCKLLALH